ncbi:hypothetical protein KR018_001743, partial [Drosophila ironensis]
MSQSQVDTALLKFIAVTDRLSQFEARINTPSAAAASKPTCRVRLNQMRSLWDRVEQEFESCSDLVAQEGDTGAMATVQAKYEYCYSVFERCSAELDELIEAASPPAHQPSDDFWGFRDLFTAIYRNNPRLTEVEKLFHLNAKTTGKAHDIVSRFPLTNDGFQAAWAELTLRFENRRLLVNGQLKQLFGLKPIAHESSDSIQKLHSTVHGCLTALRFSQINTDSWDRFLVFLVSSRLPRLTLSL